MKLVSFSVENFRSITQARQIPLFDSTVLIGPNNEGKSNILRALNAAMYALNRRSRRAGMPTGKLLGNTRRSREFNSVYDCTKDLPINLPKSRKNAKTKITLEFSLSDQEIDEFKKEINSNLNGTLIVCITFLEDDYDVKILKKGPGSKTLNSKVSRIARFVASRIQFQYIPSIRTARQSSSIVESIISTELADLESNPEYKNAVDAIKNLQNPILESFSRKTTETLKHFLPSIKKVKFSINDERRYSALSQTIDIQVDDGVITSLEAKGDGVQSLVALGLRRHVLEQERERRTYIFAIEEPEAHLHSQAIYGLRDVVNSISKSDQVIITTHSGILANRQSIGSNIIVNRAKAFQAKTLSEIRSALGIRSYDNLVNADIVLLVEGDDDKISVGSILKANSPEIDSALRAGRMIIDSLDGAGSLGAKIGLYRNILCQVHCLVDADAAGKGAVDRAKKAGLISEKDYNMTTLSGHVESEFEDLIDKSIYHSSLIDHFGVDMARVKSRKKGKWSEKMADIFTQCGKEFNDRIKQELKYRVAEAVAANPKNAIASHAQTVIDALVQALIRKLEGVEG